MTWRESVGEALAARRDERAWYLGLAAVVLLMAGSGWYQVFGVAPFYQADEQAHVGYVLALHDGKLPTIDSPIDGDEGGRVLRQRLQLTPDRNDDVWVANNPPIAYLAAAPAGAVTRILGWPGGPLVGLRLTNVAFFAASTMVVARLGRRLAGGDATVGLLAAGLFAAVPYVGAMSGAAYVDGIALLCTVAMLDTLVALTRAGPTRRQIVTLALWCAVGAGVRPMTAGFAAAAAVAALAVVAWRALPRRRTEPDPAGDHGETEETDETEETGAATPRAGVIWSVAVIALPTLVLNGWFYLRNQRLYGDPTASEHLFEKFGRTARDLPLTDVWRHEVWAPPVRVLFNRRLPLSGGPTLTWLWELTYRGLLAAALVTVAIVVVDQVVARRRGVPPRTPALGWLAAVGLLAVVVALTLQHWQGGGNIHPRYLLFGVAVTAVAVALPLVRFGARWVGVALVGALVALQAHEIPALNRTIMAQPWMARSPRVLVDPMGPTALRLAAVPIMAIGLVAFVAALAWLRPPFRRLEP